MKFVLAFARLIFLFVAITQVSLASASSDNSLGLFYDSNAAIDEIDVSPNSTHSLYLILLNPVNDEYDGGGSRDVSYVWAFECAVEPPTGDMLLSVSFPTSAVNLGSTDNIVAGFAEPVAVSSQRAATLATFNVLTMGNNPVGYRLLPASPASHSNTMAYIDAEDPDDNIVDMAPVSGSHDKPVFTFGDYTIEQDAKWGKVKALYRE